MAEIKIPITKLEVEKVVKADKPANAEGLKLKIRPIFFDKFYEKVPPEGVLLEIWLEFWDGAEKEIYDNLLDDSKDKFELTFEKEKVDFYVVGVERREIDKTKMIIDYIYKGSGKDILRIAFEPKFAGTVKITSTSQPRPNGPDSPPPLTAITPSRLIN